MSKDRIVHINWIDSGGDGRWLSREDVINQGGLAHCESVGFLIHEDEDKIMIAGSVNKTPPNNDVHAYLAIPKVAVLSITDLRRK